MSQDDYEPIHEDMIFIHTKTTGVVVKDVFYENFNFQIHDIGGQTKERKKWKNSKI